MAQQKIEFAGAHGHRLSDALDAAFVAALSAAWRAGF